MCDEFSLRFQFDCSMETEASIDADLDSMQQWARRIVNDLQPELSFWENVSAFINAVDWGGMFRPFQASHQRFVDSE